MVVNVFGVGNAHDYAPSTLQSRQIDRQNVVRYRVVNRFKLEEEE
jgi:hypothetical protein